MVQRISIYLFRFLIQVKRYKGFAMTVYSTITLIFFCVYSAWIPEIHGQMTKMNPQVTTQSKKNFILFLVNNKTDHHWFRSLMLFLTVLIYHALPAADFQILIRSCCIEYNILFFLFSQYM